MKTAIGIAAAIVLFLCCGAYYWGSEDTITCTVSEKDRTTASSGDGGSRSVHRVYTEDCGVLEVGDALPRGQFDSADVYASLEPGATYEFTTIGWRIPLLSMFPTVIDATEVQ
ncbi:hypothetical protein GCM10027447_12770 [Glycomyces halotolerans]